MLQLAQIFQSGMILQREKPVTVWGLAAPGAVVQVSIQGQTSSTVADGDGHWSVTLPPMNASWQETMTISSGEETISLKDIALGEVWLAGGQSNMEFHMRYEKHLPEVRPSCANPNLRFYDVPEIAFEGQEERFDYSRMGRWRKATWEDIEYFSAVGYYFARDLEAQLHVPVGVIGCNWGGSVSASWMNPETIRQAGPAWLEDYEAFVHRTDMDAYWKAQMDSPLNNRGNPFADAFGEFVMPRTPSKEEIGAFFASIVGDGGLELPAPGTILPHNIPGSLYRTMVSETAPYTIRGVIWYQGESDDEMHHADLYASMLTGLITDWRTLWQDDTIPFLIVQLPGYERWLENVCDHFDWIREAQELVANTVDHTWLCSISDTGEQYDIHPKNKLPVGQRLALLARCHVYGESLLCDAPCLERAWMEGNTITFLFDHAEGGLVLKGNQVNALQISTKAKELTWKCEIVDRALIVHLEQPGSSPIQAEYAQGKFYLVNLYNRAGIPAIPFRVTIEVGA